VGAAVFLFGNVLLEVHNHSRIVMTGDSKFTTSEAVLSLMRPVRISNNTGSFLQGGSVLGVTPTQVTNHIMTLNAPSLDDKSATQCCLRSVCLHLRLIHSRLLADFWPRVYHALRGTYSISMSSNSNETINSLCLPCPFGALCHGGSNISAAKSRLGLEDVRTPATLGSCCCLLVMLAKKIALLLPFVEVIARESSAEHVLQPQRGIFSDTNACHLGSAPLEMGAAHFMCFAYQFFFCLDLLVIRSCTR